MMRYTLYVMDEWGQELYSTTFSNRLDMYVYIDNNEITNYEYREEVL